jgi:GNAT superfamily N-acetyltransferase
MDVTIREARPGDVASLDILRRQAIEATFSDRYDRTQYADLVATPDDALGDWIDDDRYRVLLAATDVTPVSYAVLDRDRAELLAVFTSPDYEREGFASVLLGRLEDDLHASGRSELFVTAPDPATGLFESTGFDAGEPGEWNGLPATTFRKSL